MGGVVREIFALPGCPSELSICTKYGHFFAQTELKEKVTRERVEQSRRGKKLGARRAVARTKFARHNRGARAIGSDFFLRVITAIRVLSIQTP